MFYKLDFVEQQMVIFQRIGYACCLARALAPARGKLNSEFEHYPTTPDARRLDCDATCCYSEIDF